MTKEEIKERILLRRKILGEKAALQACPFNQDCQVCLDLFPKFKEARKGLSIIELGIKVIKTSLRHPCYFYTPAYVKRRIKNLILD